MSDATEALLRELVELHRQQLANQATAIEQGRVMMEQQRLAIARQQRIIRLMVPLALLAFLSVLLPYLWRWVQYLSA
jgi:hypothetical protein